MMMKILLYLGTFGCFAAIAYFIYRGYRARKVFFENLVSYCNHLAVEISFSKRTAAEVIDAYADGYGRAFAGVVCEYRALIESRADVTREALSGIMWTRLKPSESAAVVDFFYELGKHSAAEELQKIENARKRFESFYENAREGLRRDASIYFKICILVGIGAVILML
jgi:hypothetical protein